jgi:hypothetical protein
MYAHLQLLGRVDLVLHKHAHRLLHFHPVSRRCGHGQRVAAVDCVDELLDGEALPVSRIKQFYLETPKASLEGGIFGRATFTQHRANQLGLRKLRQALRF